MTCKTFVPGSFLAFLRDEDGITAMEYGLIAGLIAIAWIAALGALGPSVSQSFTFTSDAVAEVM